MIGEQNRAADVQAKCGRRPDKGTAHPGAPALLRPGQNQLASLRRSGSSAAGEARKQWGRGPDSGGPWVGWQNSEESCAVVRKSRVLRLSAGRKWTLAPLGHTHTVFEKRMPQLNKRKSHVLSTFRTFRNVRKFKNGGPRVQINLAHNQVGFNYQSRVILRKKYVIKSALIIKVVLFYENKNSMCLNSLYICWIEYFLLTRTLIKREILQMSRPCTVLITQQSFDLDALFNRVLCNQDHILFPLLPDERDFTYNLRKRNHFNH